MIIKKFQGRTKEEALESARRELGANIVEMNVKALKPKGIMGLFRGTRFEVTVAREEENEKYSAASAKDVQKDGVAVSFSHNEPQGKIIPMKKAEEKEDAKAVGLAVADVLSTYQPETARDEGVKERARFEGRAAAPVRENGLEEKLDSLQNLIEKQLSRQDSRPQPEEPKSAEEEKKEETTERINF